MPPRRRQRSTDLKVAAKLAQQGYVKSARAIVARQPTGKTLPAIEATRIRSTNTRSR